ncbi:MAG: UDP-glucose/GDP-mannose dehydrogenase family protein [Rhizobiales bacterium]|nr:UDP-glucose/GDP-mannose dehydrogenase family protein [Hyphomicrobiales bacterium]
MKISVIGLGKLGAPLAAVFAAKGHEVIGVDLNSNFVDKINGGIAPVDEPQLQDMIDQGRERLRATTSFEAAVLASDITCVIVPTPSNEQGIFTNSYVLSAMEALGPGLRAKAGYHVVVITSTVMPGSCDGEIRAALEQSSGRRIGINLGLCYSPEFIALGSVVHNLLNPDMVLIGESDRRAGDHLSELLLSSAANKPPVQRMNLVNAELTKISVNTYVTTKISYANMLSDICDRLPGADVDVVTTALGLDTRIGRKYLRGATGYGGPCFPRDNVAFSVMARAVGASPLLAEATDAINNYQPDRLADMVRRHCAPGAVIAVLGLSYKPDTGVIEESHGIKLVLKLTEGGMRAVCHDPKAGPGAQAVLGDRAVVVDDAAAAVRQADLVVVMTPWPEYATVAVENFQRADAPLVVIDPWRIMSEDVMDAATIIYPGRFRAGTEPAVQIAANA